MAPDQDLEDSEKVPKRRKATFSRDFSYLFIVIYFHTFNKYLLDSLFQ